MTDDLRCIDGPEGCSGPVEWRTTPDRQDFKSFRRCEAHFDQRMQSVEHTLELTSPARAPWFDAGAAGEAWEEDGWTGASPWDPGWMND